MVLCPRELARHFSAVEQVLTNRFRIGTNVNLRVLRKYVSSLFFSGNWAKKFATNPSTTYWTLVVHPVAADRRLRLIAPLPGDSRKEEEDPAEGAEDQAHDPKLAPSCKRGNCSDSNRDLEHGHAASEYF